MPNPTHIRITSQIEGFRRAGVFHSTEPTAHKISDFTDEQLLQLQAEPRLVVEFITEAETETDPAGDQEGSVVDGAVEVELKDLTVKELKEVAEAGEVEGFADMKKADLIAAIEAKRAEADA